MQILGILIGIFAQTISLMAAAWIGTMLSIKAIPQIKAGQAVALATAGTLSGLAIGWALSKVGLPVPGF